MKKYKVSFTTCRAEFGNGFVTIAFNLFGFVNNNREDHELTWPEAKAYFPEYAARQKGPVACMMSIRAPRMPAGYDAYNKTIYVEE
jgi:hypothetical protein